MKREWIPFFALTALATGAAQAEDPRLRQLIENIALSRTVAEFCPAIDTSAYIARQVEAIRIVFGRDVTPDDSEVIISYVKYRSNFEKLPDIVETCRSYAKLF